MFDTTTDRSVVATYPLIGLIDKVKRSSQKHAGGINRLTCGLMIGSGAALPSFDPTVSAFQELYQVAMILNISSAILFSIMNRTELARNGPWTIAGISVVAILAILSSRSSLEQFTPYLPFSGVVAILMTIHVIPWIRTVVQPESRINLQHIVARYGNQSVRSDGATLDPNSFNLTNGSQGDLDERVQLYTSRLDFTHMDSGRELEMAVIPDTLDISSDGDLEAGHGTGYAASTAESSDPLL